MLTQGYLATNSNGQTFVVVAMLSDLAAALPPSAEPGLPAIVRGARSRKCSPAGGHQVPRLPDN